MDSNVCMVNDFTELNDLIEKSHSVKADLSDEIKNILTRRSELEHKLEKISSLIPDFHKLQVNAENSSKLVGCASELALQLSGKVEQLDFVKNHVLKCVEKLSHIITLKNSALGAKGCLVDNKLDEAAGYVFTYLKMDKDIISLVSRLAEDDPDNNPVITLNDCQQTLLKMIIEKFDEFILKHDEKNIIHLLKIFFLLGESKQGIQRFSVYLCSFISNKCETLITTYKLSTIQSINFIWANLITEILEFIADTLKENSMYIETYCGPGNIFELVSSVQCVVDRYIKSVVERFYAYHHFDELFSMVKKFNSYNLISKRYESSGQSNNRDKMSDSNELGMDRVLAIEPIIVETLQIITCLELYLRFIRRRISADIKQCNLTEEDFKMKGSEISKFFDNSQFVRQVHDLLNKYIILEQYYLRVTIIKVLSSDEVDKSSHTWSFIDDAFFITKKSLVRSFTSGNVDSICAMMNYTCSILIDHMVNDSLGSIIRTGFPSGWVQDAYNYVQNSVAVAGSLGSSSSIVNVSTVSPFSGIGTNSLTRYHFLITINSIEASQKNLLHLVNHLESELNSIFQNQDINLQKLHMCITELKVSISDQLQELIDSAFEHLSTSVIQSQVKTLLTAFKSLKYDLLEEDLDVFAANDPWVESCITHTEDFLKPFRSVLSTENNDRFLLILIHEILHQLDQLIQRKSFSRFGAIQLEKEYRSLFAYLTSISYSSLRDNFTRSLQVCRLLNLDRIDEVHYYWNSTNWCLTAHEVRSILSLRRDFAVNEIRALKLP
ncbi:Conserved oligomeric Golgi complex subunit 4 isoform 2 [Schistosoma japonicum]|uniref:Conserved oligomeric Golgi complex subunit 4 n=3 Tax=Schistosoma japonicum TaxID=6182 RepID=A0A4Z2CPG1_SCHJA|nr:Conserved oligomeric Golgi complex subunit 4 isoform 2 [Schistosoma japonicum]TNN06158.1 Conserved oligomeric Golgi complex subunit 4 isoform 2 [Schistosoma japonicum]TNN06159.1 Conserved oligomeric Golgi complex subunit 4 isoform 2 [Schistosoma japonicum]